MKKHLLYGASIGMIVGTGSGYFNGTKYGIIVGLSLFVLATAIRFYFNRQHKPQ